MIEATVLNHKCLFDICDGQANKNCWSDIYKTDKGCFLTYFNSKLEINKVFKIAKQECEEYFKLDELPETVFDNLQFIYKDVEFEKPIKFVERE